MLKKIVAMSLLLSVIFIFTFSGRAACVGGKERVRVGSSDNPGFFLNAPSGLSADVSSFQINLSWIDTALNNDGFRIERSINDNTNYIQIATVVGDVTFYPDTNFFPATTYYYRVRAFNTVGDTSAYSNEVSAVTLDQSFLSVAAGGYHTIAISNDNTLWGWGRNEWFQLGVGDVDDRGALIQIGSDADWSAVSAGAWHNIGIKTNRTLYGWGNNEYGQLGLGDTSFDGDFPYQIGSDADWSVVRAGGYHSIALKTNRTLWSWGYNISGQLGVGDINERNSPIRIGNASDWKVFGAGTAHTIACKTTGTLWAWGDNEIGQLGIGGSPSYITTPTQTGTDSDWDTMVCGGAHTIARKNNGTIWSWGDNTSGGLGVGFGDKNNRNTPTKIGTDSNWAGVSAGLWHSIGTKTNGTVWTWGYNMRGQLGLGNSGWGTERTTPSPVGTESDWLIVSGGYLHTGVMKTNGTIWCWGDNRNGQLGSGNRTSQISPILSAVFPVLNPPSSLYANAVSSSRIDLYWADLSDNEQGFEIERKIGRNGTYLSIASVTADTVSWSDTTVSGLTTYYYRIRSYNSFGNSFYSNEVYMSPSGDWLPQAGIAANWFHTFSLKTNRTLWVWGYNGYEQLGLGDSIDRNTPSVIGTASDWNFVTAGYFHSLGIRNNPPGGGAGGSLWSWGYNKYGRLGLGDTINRNTPSLVTTNTDWANVTAGYYHSIASKINGSLWSWGINNYGQLGLGLTINWATTPSLINSATDWLSLGGANLPTLAAGGNHTVALKINRTLWSWGDNWYGQLGLGSSGNVKNTPTQVGNDSNWSQVTAGYNYTIALKTNGTLWVWGNNDYNRLGLDDYADRMTPSQIGSGTNWSAIAAGKGTSYSHAVALQANPSGGAGGTLWAWGYNMFGQTGLGDYIRSRNYPVQIGADTNWSSVSAGGFHSIARKANGTIWTWGNNQAGQLGLGDSGAIGMNRSIPNLVPVGE